jgi:hypothetical protein
MRSHNDSHSTIAIPASPNNEILELVSWRSNQMGTTKWYLQALAAAKTNHAYRERRERKGEVAQESDRLT